jgi:CubicO group peptidase (beta-lactamase class C family)
MLVSPGEIRMDDRFEGVIKEVRRQVDAGIRPSIQVAIDWRGSRVLDFAWGEDATPRSNYVLWSTTKPFIAVTLLQLVEEGRVQLDDRVSLYIPEFAVNGKEPVTLLHVLTHRGGFPGTSPEISRELSALAPSWKEAVAYVCQMATTWEPGTDRGYHPRTGWYVLGEVIQRVDDRPLPEVLRRRVLEPLGIPGDGFSLGEPDRLSNPPLPVRTSGKPGAPPESEADACNSLSFRRSVIPGGGGISRAGEVVKLFSALVQDGRAENGRILAPEMVRLATFPHVSGFRDRTFRSDIPWGLGMHLKHVLPGDNPFGRTATPGSFGHGGHFLVNVAWGDPGKDLAAAILANGLTEPGLGVRSVAALSQAVHDAVDGAVGTD